MIRLSGLEPGRDIQIKFIGIRPGERLNEILFARGEEAEAGIGIDGIVAARPVAPSTEVMRAWVATLERAIARDEQAAIYAVLHDAVPDFRGAAA
jgi:O-antigen biosynthesis protein WbqV